LNPEIELDEIWTVRTRYSAQTFAVSGTYPGAVAVARATLPNQRPITLVSVYGLIDVYSQTTLFRIIADLIPLFDSEDGERVILAGDLNVGTDAARGPEIVRYEAILRALESLGLANLYDVVADRPEPPENCRCGAVDCRHLTTREGGGQFDYLFATAPLVAAARRIVRFDDPETRLLSDHWPIAAEFDLAKVGGTLDVDRPSGAEAAETRALAVA
jgi:endonuclease/exonuclease/phosphatase family metal-dependent hydrolase